MAHGKLEFAGEFEIDDAWIVAKNTRRNIESNIIGLKIYEDMDMPFIHGEIIMYSTTSFAD